MRLFSAQADPLEVEMSRKCLSRPSDEESQLNGPLAPEWWGASTLRESNLRKYLFVFGISCLVGIGFFALGASVSSSGNNNAIPCANPNANPLITDSVAPEGPVSSSFDAKYDYRGHPREIVTEGGVVAADHGRCSDIGAAVLKDGGNAVDAAVATALCQGIYNPMASGIGGGHIMLIRLPNGTAEVIDARETAPAAANETMFKGRPEAALVGGLAAAVPLELHGLHLAHSRHGVLPWARLVEPAADIAEAGFEAHPYLVSALEMANFTASDELRDTFLIHDKHTRKWRAPLVNETCCKRPQLAQVLRDVAREGPDVLYKGKYAAQFAADIQAAGGIITMDDLANAEAVIKQPLRSQVLGVEVIAPPPPSSAATILTALLVLAGYDLPLAGSGSLGVHRVTEAMKHAFALRMSLGDPGADPSKPLVPYIDDLLQDMLSEDYAASLRSMIIDDDVLNTTMYGGKWNVLKGGMVPEDHGTSHMSIVDGNRMAVALTTTINTGFGSKVASKSTGIILNNQMDDFSTPGQPNIYGIPPSESNFIVPGKKPFSSMSPLVVERGGQIRMVLGASGGPRIISAVLQTLLRVLAYGEEAFSAVAGPRVHHQLVPEVLYAEAWKAGGAEFYYDNTTLHNLGARGHDVAPSAWGAVVQAVIADADPGDGGTLPGLRAVSDPRKDGAPMSIERAHKLAKMVYDLEAEKLELQKRLELVEASGESPTAEVQALHRQLLELKANLEAQEKALKSKEELLKIAAGKARAEVLALKAAQKSADVAEEEKGSDKIRAFISPGKTAHVDLATLQSMLRQKEKELVVFREDNAAKERELLHALELLQRAHKREEELRRHAESLSNQLDLTLDALSDKESDEEDLQAQVTEALEELAVAKDEAEKYESQAATLQSALKSKEEEIAELQEKFAFLQEYVANNNKTDEKKKSGGGGGRAAVGFAQTVLIARGAVHVLLMISKAMHGGG